MTEPVELTFYNRVMDRIAIKQIMNGLMTHFGITYATHVLDQSKTLGFRQATRGATSLGVDDLLTTPSKGWLIKDAEHHGNLSGKHYNYGNLYAVEKLRQLIETWYTTSEYLKRGMNLNFRITDPSNPVHMMSFSGARGSTSQIHQLVGMRGLMSDPQGQIIDLPIQSNFRDGLSLTEYIISCYGARKGVVDTAVRTSDAGYLTRRLVEVVQRIVVRKSDCGTTSGISMNHGWKKKKIIYQKLIGRVLAENVYINNRCLAMRNQDIGNLTVDKFIGLMAEPIRVRSPSTCKSMLWICQLCYGWSLTNGDLVEVGEAVGIIAGQSIGEPGTQLTLRTFHTGGVFTGDIAEHVRTPSDGVIEFDGRFVYPTRTRHGHPAWICHTSLFLSIRGRNKRHNLLIPAKSLLLIRNNQYVESEQVIAEIRTKASPPKERIHKYIYSDLDGEMAWITGVCHTSEYMHSCIHPTLRTCHVWVLSGKSDNKKDKFPVSFYDNQDRINSNTFLAEDKSFPSTPRNKNQSNICIFNPYVSTKNRIFTRWKLTHIVFNSSNQSFNSNIILYDYDVVRKHRTFFSRDMYTNLYFFLEVKNNGVLRNNDFFALTDHPKYELKESGVIKYGTIKIGSDDRNNESRDERMKKFRSTFRIVRGGNFFLIPERRYISAQVLSSILKRNNKSVRVGTSITSIIQSDTSGWVRIGRRINNTYEVKILPGIIYYPDEPNKLSERVSVLIPPGKHLFNKFRCDHWTYFQWIIPLEEKPFALLRPATEYVISNRSTRKKFLNLLRNIDLEINTANYLLHADGEQIRVISGRCTPLIRTCLIICWGKKYFTEKAHVSLLKIKTTNNSRNYLQLSLIDFYSLDEKTQGDMAYSQYILRKNYYDNFFSICRNQLKSKHKGIIRIPSNRKDEYRPSIILSPPNLIEVSKMIGSKNPIGKDTNNLSSPEFFNFQNQLEKIGSIRNRIRSKSKHFLKIVSFDGIRFLGNLRTSTKLAECFYWNIHAGAKTCLRIDQSRQTFQNPKWFLIDEYIEIYRCRREKNINHNLFEYYLPYPLRESTKIPSLGQFLFKDFRMVETKKFLPSGQVIGIHMDYLIIRLGKPHLANEGAIIHNNCGGSVEEGDTPITPIYERLKSGDIIQGLPKVEQLLEARSTNSVSIDLGSSFRDWSNDMKRFIGNLWGFFLSARISMEQGQMILVDQIQKVYKSQGVQISNKHIEIIVRQMTSRFLTSENGIIDIFLPGELIEFSQARRINRVLEEVISYEPILLGITKASLSTRSFISEASFQETTRVLARAALKGRIDWLKGLKENVIVGEIIPAGTGSKEVIWQRTLEREEDIFFSNRAICFGENIENPFWYSDTFFGSPTTETIRNILRESAFANGKNILPI
nr:RNA polymerase beta'' subunit [Aneura pinguis]WGO60541.1 RNA polymerase beta'' subunit [Aneura pinguis]